MPSEQPQKPESFQKFEAAMRRLVQVPKAAVDKAVREYDSGRKRTKKRKKKS